MLPPPQEHRLIVHYSPAAFAEKYGPWAVIAGGSDGIGAAFAHELARRSVNVVLVARRQSVLDQLATELRAAHGIEVRTIALDLSVSDTVAALAAASHGLDVGLLIYNAGADNRPGPILEISPGHTDAMITRNCVSVAATVRHFGAAMTARGSGGLVLVTSGAAWAGGANLAVYCATKAFDLVLAEALWAEWRPRGVDVLALVLGKTDTPAYRRLLNERGAEPGELADPRQVAGECLDHLTDGPTWSFGIPDPMGASPFGAMPRRDAVLLMSQGAPERSSKS